MGSGGGRRRSRARCRGREVAAGEAAVLACEKSIQAHGGIGFTWEHPLHRYYKRALWLEGALATAASSGPEIRKIPTGLVTGASTGIGEATARRLVALGWTVYASVRLAGDAPEGTIELVFDVTDPVGIEHAATQVEQLDALVDNAGVAIAGPLEFLAARRADAPARRQRRRAACGSAGVSPAPPRIARARRG